MDGGKERFEFLHFVSRQRCIRRQQVGEGHVEVLNALAPRQCKGSWPMMAFHRMKGNDIAVVLCECIGLWISEIPSQPIEAGVDVAGGA
jgi:hypothetical protein